VIAHCADRTCDGGPGPVTRREGAGSIVPPVPALPTKFWVPRLRAASLLSGDP
jgi:hypothetical protein